MNHIGPLSYTGMTYIVFALKIKSSEYVMERGLSNILLCYMMQNVDVYQFPIDLVYIRVTHQARPVSQSANHGSS